MAPKKKGGAKKGKGEKKPAKVLMYHDEEYWNNRYTKHPEPFDWYQSYKELKALLTIYISKDQVNMNVGCGNGLLGEEMVLDGYVNVISIDNSAVCFEQLNARYKGKKEYTGLTWFRQDMKELKMLKDLTIDNVIDKV
ncbi:hypothetical protein KC19_VG299900 [Ceratodon purpureus]|uniref:Uncharacterized protein n=1 Tax=Ceratodon purpureus TaxID=3225 RepID=A0A8T0HWP9_CERPU|nr:hypothetical protein KC19_VG299900 [Ceratodon purpureus]